MEIVSKKIIPLLLLIFSTSFCQQSIHKQIPSSVKADDETIKLLELFTSEGCSSCPPADALLANLETEHRSNVFILTYHVDYWDRLGWKDSFSSPDYTARQKLYAAKFNSESIYTPQLVVNGTTEFTGSDEAKLRSELSAKLTGANAEELKVELSKKDNNNFTLRYNLPASKDQMLNVALIQAEATTNVKRGENRGRKIHHVNIVRSIRTFALNEAPGQADLHFDVTPLSEGKFFLIAFAQNKDDLQITHAVRISL